MHGRSSVKEVTAELISKLLNCLTYSFKICPKTVIQPGHFFSFPLGWYSLLTLPFSLTYKERKPIFFPEKGPFYQKQKVLTLTGGHGAEAVVDFVADGDTVGKGLAKTRRTGFYFIIGYGRKLEIPTMYMVTPCTISTTGRSLGGRF